MTLFQTPHVPRIEDQRELNRRMRRIMDDLAQGPGMVKIYTSSPMVLPIPPLQTYEAFCPRCSWFMSFHKTPFCDAVCLDGLPSTSQRPYPWTKHTIDQHARVAVEGKDPWQSHR